jgi:pilus assembly protein TadC
MDKDFEERYNKLPEYARRQFVQREHQRIEYEEFKKSATSMIIFVIILFIIYCIYKLVIIPVYFLF